MLFAFVNVERVGIVETIVVLINIYFESPCANQDSWTITRNIIWDLHRPENKLISANKEVIMGMPNRGAAAESFLKNLTMRVLYPFYFDSRVKMPDGKQACII